MAETFRVACVQNCAERDMAPSIAALEPLIRGAAADGARLILLPEMATMLEPHNPKVLEKAQPEVSDPGLRKFRALAEETGSWILGGSLLIEPLFQYQGIGWILKNAVNQRAYPVMQGIFLVVTTSVVVANLLADLLYGRLDPRIRVNPDQ